MLSQTTQQAQSRRGLTLVELLMSTSIMALLAITLATMGQAVQMSAEHNNGYNTAVQHARIVTARIRRDVEQAHTTADYPGVWVVSDSESGYVFPDSLVVWTPDGDPTNADGPPLVEELTIYCLNPSAPNELLELTAAGDTSSAPATSDSTAWGTLIDSLLSDSGTNKVLLSDLIHTSRTSSDNSADLRGNVRFIARLRPSDAQWADYMAGSTNWVDLPWAQGVYSDQSGLRQSWIRMELQFDPGYEYAANSVDAMPALPVFDSAAIYYSLTP